MQKIHADHALTPEGWVQNICVTVAKGRIAEVTPGTLTDATSVDLLLPAPVNLHSHAFQRAMAGLTEGRGDHATDTFWTWRHLMYRFLNRLTPDHVQAIASMAYVEMLEAGFGAVAEFHYLHHDINGAPYGDNPAEMAQRISAAAEATGLGLTLLPVLYMQGGCDGRALEGGQRRFGNDLDGFARLHERWFAAREDDRIGIAAHSLRAVPPHALEWVSSSSGPLHMHVAEQLAEVDEVAAHLGARPVEWLLDNAPVDPRWCLIHCTQMTDSETTRLAATGAIVGLCPITESSLGDGIFNGTRFQSAGGRYGVGSDSNIHVALWEELATLEYSQRLRDRRRAALATTDRSTGRVLFDAATQAGAHAAGRESGAICEGHLADLIGVSTDNEVLCGRSGDTAIDGLVFSGRGQHCVTDVWSAGRHVVRDGRHIHRDDVVAAYKRAVTTLGDSV